MYRSLSSNHGTLILSECVSIHINEFIKTSGFVGTALLTVWIALSRLLIRRFSSVPDSVNDKVIGNFQGQEREHQNVIDALDFFCRCR